MATKQLNKGWTEVSVPDRDREDWVDRFGKKVAGKVRMWEKLGSLGSGLYMRTAYAYENNRGEFVHIELEDPNSPAYDGGPRRVERLTQSEAQDLIGF